jgi:hypothetical protein
MATGRQDLRVLRLTLKPLGHYSCGLLDSGPSGLFGLPGWPL